MSVNDVEAVELTTQLSVPVDNSLVSNELRLILETVFYVGFNGIIGVLGTVANIINIAVFIKQDWFINANSVTKSDVNGVRLDMGQ
ncbi:hypothetical protein Btru_074437 [Bulinus truncatus]|nr:hypothetical protein Btru_074437 [Bulinus truncatus]